MELSGYVLEALWDEGGFVLYRGNKRDDPVSVLVLATVAQHPAPAILSRLNHEYSLASELSPEWAARPLALVTREGRTMLVLEDPGGEPLGRIIGRPLDLTRFLGLAINIAAALGRAHRRDLIHKDIKPANLLADSAGNIWITGFGIASRLPRERQLLTPPEVIAGTLAYMAPEQTGRMNRSIDARSDLYSLGVTLYEMLSGTLPFTAADPLEWIHCHIARQPIPLGDRVSGIQPPVTAIIYKLLAKNPEERYQTAIGVEADLRRCLADWNAQKRIEPFPLGAYDASDRLMIPEKLYGREQAVDTLLAAFDQVVARGTAELVLVSGHSGIGKSSVVSELHKALVPRRALFAAGKFDQYKQDIPYATIVQAFQDLVRQVLGESDAEVERWRRALQEAVGANGQLMVNLIPELDLIIGKQPPVTELAPRDAQHRFQLIFRRFLGVFARPEQPLALFLDDLQWLDAATLDLLRRWLTEPEARHLLLVGAYRANEVRPSHPLVQTLEAIRNAGAGVREIVLAALTLDDVGRLVADALHIERERAQTLAALVHEKSGGNPFFAIQFVTALAEEGLLAFDRDAPGWKWDLDRIRAKGFADNVADLMAEKLSRLSDTAREILKYLACLGNVADITTLALVFGKSEQLNAALLETVRAGLVVCVNGSYAFLHDRVREASYALIPEGERVAAHARIARAAAANSAPADLEEKIFEIVNQFNRGAALITTRQERGYVAELNLIAGKRAKMSAAYESAVTYLSAGRSLLGEDRWERQHRLAFALEYQQADCELLSADFAGAEERLSMLMRRAENLPDRASVTRLLASLYTILNQNDRSTEVCLEYLRSVGVDWSARPTADEVQQEYKRISQSLVSRSIEELIQLPAMTQPDCRATIDVLTSIAPPGILTDRNLYRLVIGRMVNLTLEHGNSDGACVAYVLWGMILGSHFGEYDAGFRFGKLGLELVERPGLDRFKARVYVDFATVVNPWRGRLATGLALLRQAFNTAQETGDLTFMAYSCNNLVTHLLAIGVRLDDIRAEAENGIEFARKTRFHLVMEVITGQLLLIRALQGLTPSFSSFNDGEFDEGRFEHHLEEDRRLTVATCSYWIRKLQARFYANEYASAIEAASKAQRLLWASPSSFGGTTLSARLAHGLELAEYHFYAALAQAAVDDDAASAGERSQRLEALRHHYKQLVAWAENCPETFENRAALVGAELARIEGRELDAERLYERAILSAREHGFIQNEGIANEVAALFYTARGFNTIADTYLRNARYCYLRWGAAGKVKQLDQRYPQLLREQQDPASHSATIGTSVAQLDVGTVVKASQAVSGEIVLDRLIETLMKIALEHAGADRGMLILLRDDALQIEAEAEAGPRSIDVRIHQAAVTSAELPKSLLQTVARTRQSVIIDDAHRANPLTHDAYIQRRQPRSVLCLPLIKQTQLIGLLYLENNLALRTFTPERTAVLELLASQAAISLENARLYAELSGENRERRKVEEALRASEASLAEGQQFSHTGNFRTNVRTDEIRASAEYFRIHDLDPTVAPRFHVNIRDRVHPDDWALLLHALDQAVIEKTGFQCEYRLVMPDRSVKYLQSVGRASTGETGDVELVGTVMDITERKRADEALRSAQLELAHLTRVVTLGELAASIAHEVNQPLTAIVSNGEAGLRWLCRNPPEFDEVRASLEAMIGDGIRAGEVVHRIRGLARKTDSQRAVVDINGCIQEIIPLIQHELAAQHVSLQLRLSPMLPAVLGDKVQLQQVIINLIVNGIEAMTSVTDRQRELVIRSGEHETNVLVAVEDRGVGIDAESETRLFDAFFTTKPSGLGMGLSICRSIVEAHDGRLWASGHAGVGATFQFTLPIHRESAQ